MTKAEFKASEILRSSLNTLLEADVMKLAFSILQSEPPKMPSAIPGVSYAEQMAAEGARHVGYLQAFDDLKRLTRDARKVESDIKPQVLFADPAIQALTSKGLYTEDELKQFSNK